MKSRIEKLVLALAVFFVIFLFIFSLAEKNHEFSQINGKNEQRLDLLEAEMIKLSKLVEVMNDKNATSTVAVQEETIRREVIREKSQEELLTAAVAKISPAVVSIVVTKDVPKLEVVYVNPFGDDPFFKDFNIRVPQYQQIGTEIQKIGAATGFLVSKFGYILTNKHVVEDTAAKYTVLLANGSQKEAQVIYRDSSQDIAVIKIAGGDYSVAEFGDSGGLKLGQSVFAIGNALGEYSNTVSVGIISGLNRNIEAVSTSGATEKLNNVIQTDAAINQGNSGGPLVNLDGKVVGVNVAMVSGSQNIGFSLPINAVKSVVNSIIK